LYYCENSQVIVSAGDLQTRINQWVKLEMPRAQDKTLKEKPLKLRRKPHVSDSYVPPRSEPEKTLVRLWQQLFGFEGIGTRDDFFELGGDSLKAITLAARLHRELDVRLPLTEIFNRPCIEEMACLLESTGKSIHEKIRSVEKKEYYPLSSPQKRLYILQRMEPASTAYNELAVFILEGKPEIKLFEETFSRLVKRHESFRTSLHLVGSEPVQRIHKRVNFEIEYNKKFCGGPGGGFSKEPPGRRRQQAAAPYSRSWDFPTSKYHFKPNRVHAPHDARRRHYSIIKNFVRPFDLSRAPLLRVGLVKTDEDRYILMADMHHSITDAVSIAICIREIQALMTGKGLPTLRIQYKDYSQWQDRILTGEKMKSRESYWLKEFAENVPVLNLPMDNVRPGVRSFDGGGVYFELDREQTRALKTLASTKDVTIYMLLLAIYNIFLAKLSGTEDIVVGVPTAGRKHAESEHIIGMFVNTLAVRNYPMGTKTLAAFLREVKTRTLEAFENQDYQYEELVERLSSKLSRDADRNPLFDTMLVLQNVEMPGIELPGLTVKPYTYDQWISKFDLTLQGLDTGEGLGFIFRQYSSKKPLKDLPGVLSRLSAPSPGPPAARYRESRL
jgi:acyl carrier protein